jgi:hypothetical protein
MPFDKFCQAATGANFSTRLQQWPTDELLREPFHKIPCGHSPLKVMIMSQNGHKHLRLECVTYSLNFLGRRHFGYLNSIALKSPRSDVLSECSKTLMIGLYSILGSAGVIRSSSPSLVRETKCSATFYIKA